MKVHLVEEHYKSRLTALGICYGIVKVRKIIVVHPNMTKTAYVRFEVSFTSVDQPMIFGGNRINFSLKTGSPEEFLPVLALHFTLCDFDYAIAPLHHIRPRYQARGYEELHRQERKSGSLDTRESSASSTRVSPMPISVPGRWGPLISGIMSTYLAEGGKTDV